VISVILLIVVFTPVDDILFLGAVALVAALITQKKEL